MNTDDATIHRAISGETSLARDFLSAGKHWLRSRQGYMAVGIVLAVGGLALGWSWLAAVGVLPILLGVLPCAAMCALGLCMMPKRPASHANQGRTDQSLESGQAAEDGR